MPSQLYCGGNLPKLEMIFILHHASFSGTGCDHLHKGLANEDRISVQSRPGLTAAVICDGAGSFHSGAAAAELTAAFLSAFLLEHFEALYTQLGDRAQRTLAEAVEERLRAYEAHTGTAARELACTILAAAVHEDGRCICLHLGDGIILQQNTPDAVPSVVSSPMTGLAPHSTYLTMNCDLHRFLRFYRWECAHLSAIVLLSDGAAEHLVKLSGGAGWTYTAPGGLSLPHIRAFLSKKHPRDDHSCALISRSIRNPNKEE